MTELFEWDDSNIDTSKHVKDPGVEISVCYNTRHNSRDPHLN